MIPLINTNTKIPDTPAPCNNAPNHWLVPSSVAAVRNIQASMIRNNGFNMEANIVPVLTPLVTLSVGGKERRKKRIPYMTAGRNKTAIRYRQSMCILSIMKYEINPPITIPPGNQTWNRFNMVVLSLGYRETTSGLQAAST